MAITHIDLGDTHLGPFATNIVLNDAILRLVLIGTPKIARGSEVILQVLITDRYHLGIYAYRISFLKNRPYHQHVTEYLTLLGDEQVPEILRVRMAEALAWFNLSVRRHEIADAGRKLLARGNCSPELAKEVQRMINRVESKK